jgi:uroporphyrinogen-III synthase
MTTDGPLHGAGVLITRPARQAAGLAREIAVLGGKPLIFPAIVILPPEDPAGLERAQQEIARYDYAVFVSANAVEYGVGDPGAWPVRLTAFAPGPGTAAALAAVGITRVRIPDTTMDSEGLLALPDLVEIAGKHIAIFRGSGGRELLGKTLTERGATVDYIDCYRRAKPQAGAVGLEDALEEGRVDAVTLTSREGLENLWEMLDHRGRASLAAKPAFVPHPRVAVRARELGLGEIIVTQPADAGLLASLLEYFAATR